MVAMTRLADLESQMEFAYAKHMQLVRERELLAVQTERLRDLPVGIEAFQDDLKKYLAETADRGDSSEAGEISE